MTWRAGCKLILVAALAVASGCGRRERPALRVGFLPNLTHAVPMVAQRRGIFAERVDVPVEMVAFNAGPDLVEALFSGDLDAGWCGPGPAINAFIRSDGRVRVLAGAAEGGAALVLRSDLKVKTPADLAGMRLATPQIGNSQDISLRAWLLQNDLAPADRGGTVSVFPLANPDILFLFAQGRIDGAWVPEPWVTRLVQEAHGRIYLDEARLWPGGKFPTTLLVATRRSLEDRRPELAQLVRANREAVSWIQSHPAEARKVVGEELFRIAGKKLPPPELEAAWKRLGFQDDPMLGALKEIARASRRIGYLPRSDLRGIVVAPEELAP